MEYRNIQRLGWMVMIGTALVATAAEPQGEGRRLLRIGVLTDNPPFSYREPDGRVDGFACDLVREVEQVMGLRFQRVEGTTDEINGAFREGKLDVLQSYARFPEREMGTDFSVPYLTMEGAIFVRKDDHTVGGLASLRGRKVAVHRGSLGETVLRRAGLDHEVVYADSMEQALIMVDRGAADATLAARLSGLALAEVHGLKNLRVLNAVVAGYKVHYCIAVRAGDRESLALINEGLALLVRTKRFDEIYRRWFGHLTPREYTGEQVLLAVLAVALVVALGAIAWQRKLRRQLARQAEALAQSGELYRALFEGSPRGLLLVRVAEGGDPVVDRANQASQRMFGLPASLQEGAALRTLLGGDQGLMRLTAEAIHGRGVSEFEHERPENGGWWWVSVSPLGTRWLVTLADMTEQRRARERLRVQEEQLRNAQKLEAVGTLAGGIAHDFNNVLTAILGNAELGLLDAPSGSRAAEPFRQIMQAGQRARQLVQQILTFSRRSESSQRRLSLSPLIRETVAFLRSVARGYVEFEHHQAESPPEVEGDAAQIHQVFMNLGTNAVQAMRGKPGRLTFLEETVEFGDDARLVHPDLEPGRYVRISILDTGPGMPPDIQERIFEPFFTTKAPGEGTGLGLSVVHGIMQQHGGAVTVSSRLGAGTCFTLYFPIADSGVRASPDLESSPVPHGHGETLMFIDDDPAIVPVATRMLSRLGYSVSSHHQPAIALAEFSRDPGRFAAIVSDLAMPGMNGLQLAALVRATRPGIPFVLCSGYMTEAEADEARTVNVSAVVTKPLTLEPLGRAIANCLAVAEPQPAPGKSVEPRSS